jgi:hypothetical protein
MPHRIEDEAVATEAVDIGTLLAENAALRDRLLRALAEAENTQRRADRTGPHRLGVVGQWRALPDATACGGVRKDLAKGG